MAQAPRQPFRKTEVVHALRDAKWDLLLPFLVIVAFASGIATVVEAAAIGAAYALFVELVIYRDIHPFYELPGVFVHAASLVGAVVVLLGVALGLTNYLVEAEIPTKLVEWVQSHIHSQWAFLQVLNVMLLVLGSVLEIYSAIVVLVPLVAPLGVAFNVHPVHLGVIFLANLELGFLCPPMGLNLFFVSDALPQAAARLVPPRLAVLAHHVDWRAVHYLRSVVTMGLLRLLGKEVPVGKLRLLVRPAGLRPCGVLRRMAAETVLSSPPPCRCAAVAEIDRRWQTSEVSDEHRFVPMVLAWMAGGHGLWASGVGLRRQRQCRYRRPATAGGTHRSRPGARPQQRRNAELLAFAMPPPTGERRFLPPQPPRRMPRRWRPATTVRSARS